MGLSLANMFAYQRLGCNVRQRQVAVECRSGYAEGCADLVDAQAVVLVQAFGGRDARIGGSDRCPAAETSTGPGSGEACSRPFLYEAPLELR